MAYPEAMNRAARIRTKGLPLLAALLVGFLYLPTLKAGFVWDDPLFLQEAPLYRDPSRWWEALRQPFILSPNYFRPLTLATYLLQLRWWSDQPLAFHLANLILHGVNVLLVIKVAGYVLERVSPKERRECLNWVPTTVGLLYGLHPALAESVAFISSRFDLMVTICLLLALWADRKWESRRWSRALGVSTFFLLATLAKEMAVAFLLALPAWHLALAGEPQGQPAKRKVRKVGIWASLVAAWQVYVGLLLASGGYLLLRYALLGYLYLPQAGNPIPVGEPLQHLLLIARSLTEYLLLVLLPFFTLRPIHYADLPLQLADPFAWLSLLAVGVLGVGLVVLVRRFPRAGWLAAAGGLALLPVSNLVPLELGGGAFVAERFLTFPLVFFSLAVVPFLGWMPRRVVLPALAVWWVLSGRILFSTLPHWRTEFALWSWAAERAPLSPTAHTNLAKAYVEGGEPGKGLIHAERAVALDPNEDTAWNHKGLALFHLGRYKEAEEAFAKAAQLQPAHRLYWNNVAGALREQGRLQEAEQLLLERVVGGPSPLPVGYLNLGIVYLRADRPDLARRHLQTAVRLLPAPQRKEAKALLQQTSNPVRWLRLGDLLLKHHEYEKALAAYDQAEALGAPPVNIAIGRSAVLIERRQWQQAEQVLQAALASAPDEPRLLNNLGVIAREQGDYQRARQLFTRAATLAPNWDLPRQNLQRLKK